VGWDGYGQGRLAGERAFRRRALRANRFRIGSSCRADKNLIYASLDGKRHTGFTRIRSRTFCARLCLSWERTKTRFALRYGQMPSLGRAATCEDHQRRVQARDRAQKRSRPSGETYGVVAELQAGAATRRVFAFRQLVLSAILLAV
jgi:hypothetical protein